MWMGEKQGFGRAGDVVDSLLISESRMSSLASPISFLAIPSQISPGFVMTSEIALM